MFKKLSNELECPNCLSLHKFNGGPGDLMKLIKNFTLLSLVEAAKSTPTPGSQRSHKLAKSKTSLGSHRGGGAFMRDLDDLEECKSDEEQME
jgi:hypothetical protein